MANNDPVVNSIVQFPSSSIEFLADSNQCQHLSNESIKYLNAETTSIVRFLLQVNIGEKTK